jgi:two-component system NtrC family sensor kinase
VQTRAASLERQAATSEVLEAISNSSGELEPAFQAMLASAIRLCQAKFGTLLLFEEDQLRLVAMHGAPREFEELRRRDPAVPSYVRRLVESRQIVHLADIGAEEPYASSPLVKLARGTLVHLGAHAQGEGVGWRYYNLSTRCRPVHR